MSNYKIKSHKYIKINMKNNSECLFFKYCIVIVLSLSPDPRALLNDLIDIAKIDRRITADERKLIDQIARDII